MKTSRKLALGLSLAATAVAGAAYAEQAVQRAPVTRAEAQARAEQRFARLDANHDGKLDQADRAARRAAVFDRLDADHNGQISRAEFEAPRARGADGANGPGMHRFHRGSGMMGGRFAGAGKSGPITQAEFTSAALQRFDRADANHDGTVTAEERRAARKAQFEQRRERWQNRAGAEAAPKAD